MFKNVSITFIFIFVFVSCSVLSNNLESNMRKCAIDLEYMSKAVYTELENSEKYIYLQASLQKAKLWALEDVETDSDDEIQAFYISYWDEEWEYFLAGEIMLDVLDENLKNEYDEVYKDICYKWLDLREKK